MSKPQTQADLQADRLRHIHWCKTCDQRAYYRVSTDSQGFKMATQSVDRPLYCLRHAEDRAEALGRTYKRHTE